MNDRWNDELAVINDGGDYNPITHYCHNDTGNEHNDDDRDNNCSIQHHHDISARSAILPCREIHDVTATNLTRSLLRLILLSYITYVLVVYTTTTITIQSTRRWTAFNLPTQQSHPQRGPQQQWGHGFPAKPPHRQSLSWRQRRRRRRGRRLVLESFTKTLSSSNEHRQQTHSPSHRRVLYIVTSMNEYDNGRRETKAGYDRFSLTILPIMVESIQSMQQAGYQVDAYLITHYAITEQRRHQMDAALSCAYQVWDEATPLGYKSEDKEPRTIQNVTRGLARQHRYVIKDKFLNYDFFVSFEDDMLIKGPQLQHFQNVTQELYRLRQQAPDDFSIAYTTAQAQELFYGEMTQWQLRRMLPGFIRVEVALPNFQPTTYNRYERIPVDYDWNTTHQNCHIDPSICCHVSPRTSNEQIPLAPTNHDLYFWETSIDVLGVRKLPEGAIWDWVVLQAGNSDHLYPRSKFVIGDYWTGRGSPTYFGSESRPLRTKGRYMNNQGGWMGTRRQIRDWHAQWCRGGYLPPFDQPGFLSDGLEGTVEYWSGGGQLVGLKSCNLQRIITLDPGGFSRQLLYHTSNNKQRATNVRHRYSSRTVDEFWGQLNTIRKNAEANMKQEQDRDNKNA